MSRARAISLEPETSHVVVVGAGGIGCPAAWGLADAGVGRVTVVDSDDVAWSNLPRQVLYRPGDVGRPKALVAAERLAGLRGAVVGIAERLDDENEAGVLADCDLLLDATDGALTKDWLNALAVRRRLPLVHAAGLRSEGRILDVPPGGKPCLACLFGRLEAETGSCADLGVWGGVVGAIGFLAAASAIWRLQNHDAPSRGYAVLDLESGRAITLGAEASPTCPVCGEGAQGEVEPYPEPAACAVDLPPPADTAVLDLVGEECPMNLLRARQAVEALDAGDTLEIRLGEEGMESVPEGLRALGHELVSWEVLGAGLRLVVRNGSREAAQDAPLERDLLLRFARQVVLPEVGEAGQRRLAEASVLLAGEGPVHATAALYLAAAGVGVLGIRAPVPVGPCVDEFPYACESPEEEKGSALARGLRAHAAGRVAASHLPRRPDVVVRANGGPEHEGPGWVDLETLYGLAPGFEAFARDRAAFVAALKPMTAVLPLALRIDGPAERALGALLADTVCRCIVLGKTEPPAVVVREDGTIGTVRVTTT